MAQHNLALTLGNVSVRQHDGLFSLNDLHKASGGQNKQRPSLWVDNQQTKDLAKEISKAGIPALVIRKGGASPGSYACLELVIAYAAWISPAFHLQVIRVFLAAKAPAPPPLPATSQPLLAAASLYRTLCEIHRETGLTAAEARLLANDATFGQTGIHMLPPQTPVAGVVDVVAKEPKDRDAKARAISYIHHAAEFRSKDRTQSSFLMDGKMPHSKLLKLMKMPARGLKAVLNQALEEKAIKKIVPVCGAILYVKA